MPVPQQPGMFRNNAADLKRITCIIPKIKGAPEKYLLALKYPMLFRKIQ